MHAPFEPSARARTTVAVYVIASFMAACGSAASSGAEPATPASAAEESAESQPAASSGDSSNDNAPSQSASGTAAKAAAPEPGPAVPEACDPARGEADCVPPPAWVTKLCNGVFAEVALYMFRGGTPWQRLYLRGKTRAVNASGGATVEGSLLRDEEVLVLRHRKTDASEMQIGDGSGQYDALRWNGSCVSLEGGEVTTRKPSKPGQSRIEWSWIGQRMRGALRKNEELSQAFQARQKECKGVTTGAVSKACERLDQRFIERLAEYVRSGPELPEPEDHP
jgi:hypothetical protein